MAVAPSRPDWRPYRLPEERGRRYGTLSLLMVAATAPALALAWAAGTVLGLVFDLDEQETLAEAGAWGYVAGACLIGFMVAPALAGIVLGARARALRERRLGTMGIVVNALVATYLVVTSVGGLVFG